MSTPDFNDPAATVGDIVTADFRTAAVFERHGVDFCCGGATTLGEACAARRLDPAALARELAAATNTPPTRDQDYASWSLTRLIDHIERAHHTYVRENMAQNAAYARKIADVHSDHHPELVGVAAAFGAVAAALDTHLEEEEQVVFPAIRRAEAAAEAGAAVAAEDAATVADGLASLTRDHEEVGAALHGIRDLAMGFALPPDACATYALTYQRLKAFEADIHKHVHLENNVLFPGAARFAPQGG